MKDIIVIGVGKIGTTVAGLLASTGDYHVTLADRSPEVLDRMGRDEDMQPTTLQDVVIITVIVSGHKEGRFVQETYANKIYSRVVEAGP